MGFNDFVQAIQFGAGMLHGFQKQTEELRKHHETQQMELLKLLSQDKTKSIEPLQQENIVGEQGFFGGGALKDKEGNPAFRIGGNAFTVKSRKAFQPTPFEDTQDTATPAPIKSLQEEIPSAPTTPTAPAATPDLQTSVPGKTPIQQYIVMKAKQLGIPPEIALAQAHLESGFDNSLTGKAGEIGIYQIHPDTVAETGYTAEQLRNPKINVDAGLTYLKKQVDAYGGDINKGLARYNGDISGKNNYVANVQKFVPQYRQAASAIQPAVTKSQEQAAATPDTSMLVAGEAAPAPKPPKLAREEYGLGPESTIQQVRKRAAAESDASFAGSYEEPSKIISARRAAVKDAETRFFQEEREIAAAKKALRPDIHNLRLLDMLDHVHSAVDLSRFLKVKDATPEQDMLAPTRERVAAAVATGDPEKRERATMTAYADLLNRNYTDAQIKETLLSAGVNDSRELAKAAKLGKQQAAQQVATQQALIPGEVEKERQIGEERSKQQLKTRRAEIPIAVEQAGLITEAQARAKEKTEPIVTNEADRALIGQRLVEEIKAGTAPKDMTVDAYAREHPDIISWARNTNQALKDGEAESTDPFKMEARISFPNKKFSELKGPELAQVREKVEKQKEAQRFGDAQFIKQLDADIKNDANLDKLMKPGEAQFFKHKDTMADIPADYTYRDFREHAAEYIRVGPSERKQIEATYPVLSQIALMRDLVKKVYGPGGTLENMSKDKSLISRIGTDISKLKSYALQKDPDMIQLDKLLAEYGAKSSRMFDGATGNVAYRFLEPTIQLQPRINVGSLSLPATRERLESDFDTAERQIQRNIKMLLGMIQPVQVSSTQPQAAPAPTTPQAAPTTTFSMPGSAAPTLPTAQQGYLDRYNFKRGQ